MTTMGPDRPLTAADLLFGSSADAPEVLARQVVSAGRGQNLGRALEHLPRVTREAAIREAALAAAVLLKVNLVDVLVAGWRDHRDIHSAARRTLAMPGSKELVGVAPHRISTVQQQRVPGRRPPGRPVRGHRGPRPRAFERPVPRPRASEQPAPRTRASEQR